MPTIIISAAAHDAIRDQAIYEWHETGRQLDTGEWEIPVDAEVFARLAEIQNEHGLDFSTILLRMCQSSH